MVLKSFKSTSKFVHSLTRSGSHESNTKLWALAARIICSRSTSRGYDATSIEQRFQQLGCEAPRLDNPVVRSWWIESVKATFFSQFQRRERSKGIKILLNCGVP
uniref:Uncharacterized protein n=1 Tax=Culex nigripalpus nucleopolyhedrovirus TaxID=130556 RepID=Q99GR1_NPVCN|nr:unknown [Culex nigripalpus nucleopolyhedrovirus]